eukprot:scaffold41901_cov54-Phaeocystis_antarctica.AAC.1
MPRALEARGAHACTRSCSEGTGVLCSVAALRNGTRRGNSCSVVLHVTCMRADLSSVPHPVCDRVTATVVIKMKEQRETFDIRREADSI